VSDVRKIELSVSEITVIPGTNYPLPKIFCVTRDGGDRIPLTNGEILWTGGIHLQPEGKLLKVSRNATPGTKGKLRVSVKLGSKLFLASCTVKIVHEIKTGYMTGRVVLKYHYTIKPGPESPLMAVIRLSGPSGIRRASCLGRNKFRFDNLERGRYTVQIESIKLPKLPDGYYPSPNQGLSSAWFDMPRKPYGGNEEWRVGHNLNWSIRSKPPTNYRLYGRVTYKGKPIDGITVTVRDRNNSSSTNKTDSAGYYSIDSKKLTPGKYWISALKMVGQDSHWASDGDLMDLGTRPEIHQPLTVVFPLSAMGKEINIKCLTRKELFSDGNSTGSVPDQNSNNVHEEMNELMGGY
jgi:hypothetical protein